MAICSAFCTYVNYNNDSSNSSKNGDDNYKNENDTMIQKIISKRITEI